MVFDQIEKKMAELSAMKTDLPDDAEHGVEDVLDAMQKTMYQIIANQNAFASSALIRSVRWRRMYVSHGYNTKNSVYKLMAGGTEYDAGHAPFVEFGTGTYNQGTQPQFVFEKPSDVPMENIRTWLIQKGLPHDKGTAWAVKRQIEKYGTPAQPFFRPAVNVHSGTFGESVHEHVHETVQRYNR